MNSQKYLHCRESSQNTDFGILLGTSQDGWGTVWEMLWKTLFRKNVPKFNGFGTRLGHGWTILDPLGVELSLSTVFAGMSQYVRIRPHKCFTNLSSYHKVVAMHT